MPSHIAQRGRIRDPFFFDNQDYHAYLIWLGEALQRDQCALHGTAYKLHIDAADGGIPISCIPAWASSHDSQSEIPLAAMTSRRVTNLYGLMESAYDAPQIHGYSRQLGYVPLIDIHTRRDEPPRCTFSSLMVAFVV